MEGAPPAAHARGNASTDLSGRNWHDDQVDPAPRPGSPWRPIEGRCTVRTLGDPDLHRRTALRWLDRALGDRPSDEPRDLRHLCREPTRSDVEPGDMAIPDNLSSHTSEKSPAIPKERGAGFLFRPPCSPASIRSRWPSPSSRRICGRRRRGPSTFCGKRSAQSATSTRHRNAPTTPKDAGYVAD